MSPPDLSVVIPTHQRRAMLAKHLGLLAQQLVPGHACEIVVVADACSDGTEQMVEELRGGFPCTVQLISHNLKSASASRNAGGLRARGRTLLFLDDDIEPGPSLIGAHAAAQTGNTVVLGYSEPAYPAEPSLWQRDARLWWQGMYFQMSRPGHRFTYRDFFSGNVSLPGELFRSLGGFDTELERLEDYELGLRLLKAGARFVLAPEAAGRHYDRTDLRQWLTRIRLEGKADVRIAERHPETRPALWGLLTARHRLTALVRRYAFAAPDRGDAVANMLLAQVDRLERLRFRRPWRRAVGLLREHFYARGVAGATGGWREFLGWLQDGPAPAAVALEAPLLDLERLPPADQLAAILASASADGLRVAWRGAELGALAPVAGAEPLRLEHVRPWARNLLRNWFVPELMLPEAAIREGSAPC